MHATTATFQRCAGTSYAYDNNANIELLNRYRGIKIDGLDYTYDNNEKSNRLLSVTDAGTTEGYRATGGTYQYDLNGNLTTDPSKGTTISYNMLNLPEEVGFGANDNVRYTYDAAGNKRIKVVEGINAENNTRLDYSGNFLYEAPMIKKAQTSMKI